MPQMQLNRESPRQYSENMIREFYISYAAMVKNAMSKKRKKLAQPPLLSTIVRDFLIDISEQIIGWFLHGPTY